MCARGLCYFIDERHRLDLAHGSPEPKQWLFYAGYAELCREFARYYHSQHGLYINYEQTIKIVRILDMLIKSVIIR